MSTNLINAFLITAIGMGLVFAAILLLWVMMAALVRITGAQFQTRAVTEEENCSVALDRKKRAAAIAVGVALAQQADQNEPHAFPLPPTPLVSAWQAVMRTKMHTKRGTTR